MRWRLAKTLAVVLLVAACNRQAARENVSDVKEEVTSRVGDVLDDIAVPWGGGDDPKQRERERFDERWRQLQSFRAGELRRAQAASAARLNLRFVPGGKESFKGLNAAAINNAPIVIPIQGDVAGPSVLKTQVYLDRNSFSVGGLDGRWGRNSAIALWWYQRTRGLEPTGAVDEPTFRSLAAGAGGVPAVVSHRLSEDDVKGPFVSIPEDVYEQEELDCLCYESLPEKLAERFHTTIEFLELLNPEMNLSRVSAGTAINVPNVRPRLTTERPDIARVVISIAGSTFNAYDAAGNLIFHTPTTLGSKYDPSPSETVVVRKVAHDPHFHYQPTLFAEVPDTNPEAHLKPGPNSPVGVVWIALSKKHFGIHGTKDPDSIGYASSHGCVRLTNWDAEEVAHRIRPDVPIEFVDTRRDDSDKTE